MNKETKDKLSEAKEILGYSSMELIRNDLNLESWDSKTNRAICPFHKINGEQESTPSFGWYDKANAFKCFGCGKVYDIYDHYMNFYNYSSKQSLDKIFFDSNLDYTTGETNLKDYVYPTEENTSNIDKAIKYLQSRKISENTCRKSGIGQDSKGNIAFHFYDEFDTLLTVKYRPSHKVEKGKTKTWSQEGVSSSHILWNMNKVSMSETLIICEGEIDAMSMIECGYTNVVSIPFGANNYQWIERNWSWLDAFEDIIICADNDSAGERMIQEVLPRLGEWRCRTVVYPIYENRTTRDVNEVLYFMGKEAVITMIENAKDIPIDKVVNMSKIKEIDLSTAIGVKTRIKYLDKRLGRLFMGTLVVWTGINGSGKSSFINQVVIAEAIDQGFKSFIFSGELSKEQVKNWIDYPLAGRDNIEEIYKGEDQPMFYKVLPEAKKRMEEWYDEKVYIYDDEIDTSAKSIISKMEILARKHGVKVFLIDNLMTVDIAGLQGVDKWDKQTKFAIMLKEFAINFNVTVHLVAHPRKLDVIKRLSKMDVSGSGDLTNLAHYVFSVHRVTQEEKEGIVTKSGEWVKKPIPWDVIIDCFKNRPVGYQDFSVYMKYDMRSRRFSCDTEGLSRKYSWETESIYEKEEPKVYVEHGDIDELF